MKDAIQKGDGGEQVVQLQQRLNSLGADSQLEEDGEFGEKTEAAVIAFQKLHHLKADGIVGPKTTVALRNANAEKDAEDKKEDANDAKDRKKEKIMSIAKKEIGVREVPGKGKTNERIEEYHQSTTLKATEDEVPWCASFVGWVLKQAGIKGTGSAAAKSYATFGKKGKGEVGDIVVFTRKGGGHVAFLAKPFNPLKDTKVYVLGGNQGNAVTYKNYDAKNLIAIRSV